MPLILPELFKGAPPTPGDEENALPELIRVTTEAIVEVLLICLVGYLLGRRGTIDGRIKRSLNKVRNTCTGWTGH